MIRSVLRLVCLCLCLSAAVPAQAANPFPRAAASYLVKSGETTVWSFQAEKRRPPASLTKVMTALLVLERSRLDDVVAISAEAAAETGSRIRLQKGERLLVGDLLAAMLIKSANDAAHALADHISGNEKRFVALMNQRAVQLGLNNTHFMNASGHDHPHHYSTAADLARLAEAALDFSIFRTLVSQSGMDIHTVNGARTFHLKNSNKLLGTYDGLVGVKTGFTSKAGPCLIALAERGEERVLLVLLNSPQRWKAAPRIFDRAFGEKTRLAKNKVALLDKADPPSPKKWKVAAGF